MERRSTGRRGSGGVGLVAVVAAGCAVAVLAAGPSWALRRPEPRPVVDVGATLVKPSNSDLEVVRIDPDPAPPGGSTTIHAFVGNGGPDTTASPFTVVVTLPEGVTPEEPFFPEDCEVFQNGHRVRCVFPAGLKSGRSATALVPVRLSPDLPLGPLQGGWVAVRSADDKDETNNRKPFEIRVVETTND
ncbi:hypothetical protein ACIRS1_00995 [Kitasatospora sp. NPDC101176]|uniref:hypothetical protein n=1 Tax=Kitasatospora sp. NPDC101176 TaxID=3364099 RepID=UPI0037F57B7E